MKMKNNTSARIKTLSGFLYITRIFAGGMDDGFDATLYSNDRVAGECSMTNPYPYENVSHNQTVFPGNVAGWLSNNRIQF